MKVALLVSYDGTGFRGVARQRGRSERTVQGVLEERLEVLLRGPVRTTVAGRTDAGVHARGQVVSFEVADETDVDWLKMRLNKWVGPEVAVRAVAEVPSSFHARHSARRRVYEYTVYRSDVVDPFLERYAVRVAGAIDVRGMRAAARTLIGEHDFASFCRGGEAPTTRRVRSVAIVPRADGRVVVRIVADSFCQQMVRSIVGTLLEVGRGDRDAADMQKILDARDRSAAGGVAPAKGLALVEVGYPRDPFRTTARPASSLRRRRSGLGSGGTSARR